MKKLLITILSIFGICFSFCSADYIIYEEGQFPNDCDLTYIDAFPDGQNSYQFGYNCLSPDNVSDTIFFTNSTFTYSFGSLRDLYGKLICSPDGIFYIDTTYYEYISIKACNVVLPTSPKFKVNYGSTSYEYELEDNLFIHLKSPVNQNGNTFSYAGSTGINLFYNGTSQFYSKSNLYLESMYWFNNSIFTPICL